MKLAAIFPVELTLHALVMHYELPFAVTVLVLTATVTVMAVWVVEPSAIRLLARWLHGPALRARERMHRAERLWRIRVRVRDEPGHLEALTKGLAQIGTNILTVHVHRMESDALDELIVATPPEVTDSTLRAAIGRAGGRDTRVWPASAMTLIDGQTKALTLAARVSCEPQELPLAVAELLGARYLGDGVPEDRTPPGEILRIDTGRGSTICCVRPGDPFTPAEIARAERLRDLATTPAHR